MDAEGLLDILIKRLAPEMEESLRGWDSAVSKLSKLRSSLIAIRNVLNDLDNPKRNSHKLVKSRLNKVKHALYDTEDVIDEIHTVALQQRLYNAEAHSTQAADSLDSLYERVDSRIEEINGILEEFTVLINHLGRRASSETQQPLSSPRLPATSLAGDSTLHWRDSKREEVIRMLEDCAPGMSNLRVVAIIGVPGIGKTTLAQSIFNHPRAGEIFDIKAWIYVPEVFDIFQFITSILDLSPKPSSTVDIYDSVTNLGADEHTKDLDFIQKRLHKAIATKRFLIVLDDVWDQNFNSKSQWDTLCLSLQSAAAGSTIIVTTHSKDIAIRFHPILTLELPKLSHDDCWTLIKGRVFADPHAILDRSLEEIGWRIAAKCNGLPLAAKAVGGLLENASDAREWENIENNSVWDSSPGRKEILPALFLSYKFLPSHLRRCFAYCSIFPKNYQFQKDKLLLLWMAEGFIDPATSYNQVKGDCFDDLLARSFFQESSSKEHYFTMHDLIRELAVHVMGEFGFALEANASCVVPVRPRHFTYQQCQNETADRFSCIVDSVTSQTLRTFLSTGSSLKEPLYYLSSETWGSLGQSFGSLRVLSLCGYGITSMPPSIERLTLLHYLDFSSTLIEEFPETLCRLCNLRTLLLSDCHRLKLLPSKFGDLIQLHHLDIRGTTLLEMPEGIGKLSSLQMLSDFVVRSNRGASIGELGGLEHLKGHLRVSGLGNVVSEEDAKAAKLFEKMHLDRLHLVLDGHLGNNQYERVLEGLRPPSDLRRLAIFNYQGKTFPNWVGDAAFHKLENLHLKGCSNCIKLPPVGQLPLLKYLTIEGFPRVATVGLEFYGEHHSSAVRSFPFLKILKFKQILNWRTWFTPEADASLFPRLEEIHIEDCEYLRQGLPLDLPSLKVLIVRDCKCFSGSLPRSPLLSELTVESSFKMDLRSLAEFTCLTSLRLCGRVPGESPTVSNLVATLKAALPRLTSLQSLELGRYSGNRRVRYDEFAQEPLCLPSSVRSISISRVNGIERTLNSFALQHSLIYNSNDPSLHFPASNYQLLNYLEIEDFHHLEEFPIIAEEGKLGLTSLRELFIRNCPVLSIFPAGGMWAFNLTTLHIRDCRGLKSLSSALPECFPSLRHLVITHCEFLKSFAEDSLPRHLQTLRIRGCSSFESLPESISMCAALQRLEIDSCGRLKLFPACGFPPNLCKLKISSCLVLRYPPIHCNLTCLKVLDISNCGRIQSFLVGSLPPNLEILCFRGCNASKCVDWQLNRLVFLKRLRIEWNFGEVDSFPADGALPSGLTHLWIYGHSFHRRSFRSLNCRELQRIKCLQELEIRGCSLLETFSGDLPQSLRRLVIGACPLARRWMGPDADRLSHIPCVVVTPGRPF